VSPTKDASPQDPNAASSSSSRLPPDLDHHNPDPSANATAPADEQSASDTPSRAELARALDCARILIAPVLTRQKERAEKAAMDKAAGINKKKPLSISIPLHGPRVEIILAWLGAVHLFELDTVA
jgi:hypothetical protein